MLSDYVRWACYLTLLSLSIPIHKTAVILVPTYGVGRLNEMLQVQVHKVSVELMSVIIYST